MRKSLLRIVCSIAIGCVVASTALSQGRGRGVGLGRKSDVFVNGHDARNGQWDGRRRDQSWKCGVFVNCHDARNGRWDGRGRRSLSRNRYDTSGFVPRGARIGHRNRYDMNDYWNRRHLMNGPRYATDRWRYRSRAWRNR